MQLARRTIIFINVCESFLFDSPFTYGFYEVFCLRIGKKILSNAKLILIESRVVSLVFDKKYQNGFVRNKIKKWLFRFKHRVI